MEEGGVRPLELQGQGGDGAGLKEDKSKPFLEREVVRKKIWIFSAKKEMENEKNKEGKYLVPEGEGVRQNRKKKIFGNKNF